MKWIFFLDILVTPTKRIILTFDNERVKSIGTLGSIKLNHFYSELTLTVVTTIATGAPQRTRSLVDRVWRSRSMSMAVILISEAMSNETGKFLSAARTGFSASRRSATRMSRRSGAAFVQKRRCSRFVHYSK